MLFRVTRSSGHTLNKTLENATLNHRPTTDNHSLTFTPKGNECNLHVLSIVKRYDTTSPCDSQGIHETNKNIFQQEKALFENTLLFYLLWKLSFNTKQLLWFNNSASMYSPSGWRPCILLITYFKSLITEKSHLIKKLTLKISIVLTF